MGTTPTYHDIEAYIADRVSQMVFILFANIFQVMSKL